MSLCLLELGSIFVSITKEMFAQLYFLVSQNIPSLQVFMADKELTQFVYLFF